MNDETKLLELKSARKQLRVAWKAAVSALRSVEYVYVPDARGPLMEAIAKLSDAKCEVEDTYKTERP
jgi:hypothetical protein